MKELGAKIVESFLLSGGTLAVLLTAWRVWNRVVGALRLKIAQKAVLITGCDTGFGYLIAKQLYRKGARVFALCLTPQGAKKLKDETGPSLETLVCDVTDESAIERAKDFVYQKCSEGLWGLINNAGINQGLFTDMTPLSTFRRVMDVNFFSYVVMVQSFLPLLRKARGRIVNVASVAGRLSAPPLAAYGASKHAVEGFSDALRLEVKNQGVNVVILEPGFMKTPIVLNSGSSSDRDWQQVPREVQEYYGEEFIKQLRKHTDVVSRLAGDPQQVVDTMEEALFTFWPRTRYLIGADTWIYLPLSLVPGGLRDFVLSLIPSPLPQGLQKR